MPNMASELQALNFIATPSCVGHGELDYLVFPRLVSEVATQTELVPTTIHWEMSTWEEEVLGRNPLLKMHLKVALDLPLVCQACLQPYMQSIDAQRDYVFFETEQEAEIWDFDPENTDAEDALVRSERFNFLELIEEEILLSLPLTPKHQTGECKKQDLQKAQLILKDRSSSEGLEKPNPFAVLAKLKKQ